MSTLENQDCSLDSLLLLKRHERYSLDLVFPSNPDLKGPIYLQATPLIHGYRFDKDEDSRFNLSSMVGNENGGFVWRRAAFEDTATDIGIRQDAESGARILYATLTDMKGVERSAELNLDKFLDVVEYRDEDSREVRRKLGEKLASDTRSVVLCFDGTSNHFSKDNTNVVKLVSLLKKSDPAKQVVYYQTGVGTYAPPGLFTDAGLFAAAKADEAMAWFLYQHVIDGYKYLMQTYQDGDEISIFGFSRGAYTARALAGMLHSVGLLPKHNIEHIPFAYQVYETSQEEKDPDAPPSNPVSAKDSSLPKNVEPEEFKRTFCIPVKINLVGVWDTVGSVGAFTRKVLPWIGYNPSIRFFRQALALDENRGNFIPSVWNHSLTKSHQSALEVWFKGGHSDIGGGAQSESESSPNDDTKDKPRALLSNITLRWMVRQCLELDTVILFDIEAMQRYRDAEVLEERIPGESYEDRQTRIDLLDARDVTPEPYLALKETRWWLVLEYLPVPKLNQLALVEHRSRPDTVWSPNAGAARCINYHFRDRIHIHSSVVNFLTTQAKCQEGSGYTPSAIWYGFNDPQTGSLPWPYIEEGLSSMIVDSDQDMAEVRKRLNMSWKKVEAEKEGEKGWSLNPLTWFRKDKAKLN